MQSRHSYARAHEGPGGLINPMQGDTVTNLNAPRIDGGDMLTSDEFDNMIRAKFVRRRADVTDFEPTIAVEHTTDDDRAACSACKGQCHTPEACGRPENDPHRAARGIVNGVLFSAGLLFCAVLLALPWLLRYIA